MAQDKLGPLQARAILAHQKMASLGEGLEPEMTDDAMGIRSWRPARPMSRGMITDATSPHGSVAFYIPMTRAHRLATAWGATSFHFAHSFINKVSTERMEDRRRNRPGAVKAHNAYIERETAVAVAATDIAVDVADVAIAASPKLERAVEAHSPGSAAIHAVNYKESENAKDEQDRAQAVAALWSRSGRTAADRPVLQRYLATLDRFHPGRSAGSEDGHLPGSEASVRLLSGGELVRRGRHAELLLRGAPPLSVDPGAVDDPLRRTQSRTHHGTFLDVRPPQEGIAAQTASRHDRYVVRGSAVAVQPDGDRVLFTNIDEDAEKRDEFWHLVEEHERVAGPDQMSCRFADRPAFWADIVQHPDCPATLQLEYQDTDHETMRRFDIESGEKMRAFLSAQDGWIPERKRRPDDNKQDHESREHPFAKFHDGRNGRVQYRIVGELPNELTLAGRVALLRSFADEFRKRKIPFVAVMHAPDHNNNEKNWHFHLIYYDRPCARITNAQITERGREGYDTDNLRVGMWDFAAVTNKLNRANRPATPLQQKKVTEVGNDRWIKILRHRFAEQTNALLAKEGVARRVDPQCYAEMGISADPQEHLGTKQAAAETRGVVTPTGAANENRQARAISASIDAKHEADCIAVSDKVESWRERSAGRPAETSDIFLGALDRFAQAMAATATLDHMSAHLRLGIERAISRATQVRQRNEQLVKAIDADSSAGSAKERRERDRLVSDAAAYLATLEMVLRDEQRLIVDCDLEARANRDRGAMLEAQLAAAIEVEPIAIEMLRPASGQPKIAAIPITSYAIAPAAPASIERWISRVERNRPLIEMSRFGLGITGEKQEPGANASSIQGRLRRLYERQQADIRHLEILLRAKPEALTEIVVGGQRGYSVRRQEPHEIIAFERYQKSRKIAEVIQEILVARAEQAKGERASAEISTPERIIDGPSSFIPNKLSIPLTAELPNVVEHPDAEALIPMISTGLISPTVPVAPVVEKPMINGESPGGLPTAMMRPNELSESTSTSSSGIQSEPKTGPAMSESARIVSELLASGQRLTLASDDLVDRQALLDAKVAGSLLDQLRLDQKLIKAADDQIAAALVRITAHATLNPTDLTKRDGRVALGGTASLELVELARFHANAPYMSEQLEDLYVVLHRAHDAATEQQARSDDMPSPIQRYPEHFSTIEPDYAMRAEATAYALEVEEGRQEAKKALEHVEVKKAQSSMPDQSVDSTRANEDTSILHGEAARLAALRAAAAQRG